MDNDSSSLADILEALNQKGEVELVIKVSKKTWMDNPMLQFAIKQAKTFGIDIHILGVKKAS